MRCCCERERQTMTHADAFLQDILAHPDDDTPRLIFADWLEEQGDANSVARAEFIRVQCSLANDRLPAGRRANLERRAWTFLMQYGGEWARPVRRLVETWEFHRGFIGEVTLWGGTFLPRAARLFRRAPIQHVRLWREEAPDDGRRFSLPALAESKHLRRLRSLDLNDTRLESQDVRALVVSKHLTNLTSLSLAYNRIGDGGIRALAEAPLLGQLMYLDLSHNTIRATGARALAGALEQLARSLDGLRLRRVDLSGNGLGMSGRQVFLDSRHLRRVVRC
jgi:uncharacterized protein (TIGR02996 family)